MLLARASTAGLIDYVQRLTQCCRAGLDDVFIDLDGLYSYISEALKNIPGARDDSAASQQLDKMAKGISAYLCGTTLKSKEIYHEDNTLTCLG